MMNKSHGAKEIDRNPFGVIDMSANKSHAIKYSKATFGRGDSVQSDKQDVKQDAHAEPALANSPNDLIKKDDD